MRYRYLDDFPRGISVFAIFSYGIAVLGTPQCPPPWISGTPAVLRYESTGQLYFRVNIKRDKEASWKTSRGILQNTERRMQNTE